jgi:hypothetical protein
MERLTDKSWRNLDPWECCGQDKYCKRGCHEKGGCTHGCIVPKLYEKLATYEDLEEQWLLLRLPCKVGTIVYAIGLDEESIDHFSCKPKVIEYTFDTDMIELFGKTVFLTKEEAEQALKRGGFVDENG